MSSNIKRISNSLIQVISILAVLIFITPVYAGDSTTYVRLTDSPFSPPHYIFSTSPNGESIDVALEKGFSYLY